MSAISNTNTTSAAANHSAEADTKTFDQLLEELLRAFGLPTDDVIPPPPTTNSLGLFPTSGQDWNPGNNDLGISYDFYPSDLSLLPPIPFSFPPDLAIPAHPLGLPTPALRAQEPSTTLLPSPTAFCSSEDSQVGPSRTRTGRKPNRHNPYRRMMTTPSDLTTSDRPGPNEAGPSRPRSGQPSAGEAPSEAGLGEAKKVASKRRVRKGRKVQQEVYLEEFPAKAITPLAGVDLGKKKAWGPILEDALGQIGRPYLSCGIRPLLAEAYNLEQGNGGWEGWVGWHLSTKKEGYSRRQEDKQLFQKLTHTTYSGTYWWLKGKPVPEGFLKEADE